MSRRRAVVGWIVVAAAAGAYAFAVTRDAAWGAALRALFPGAEQVLYQRARLATLVTRHLALVGVSSLLAVAVGVAVGVLVTRQAGRPFRELAGDLASLGQTIPPVAVLALAVPVLGFGLAPTVLALFLYSVLPVMRGTIVGLEGVAADVVEAARGMGMTPAQRLVRIELPLAAGVIMAGVRVSVVVNIGTATVGAVIGAGGLGEPIIAGLVRQNPAFVVEGGIASALLAVIADQLLARIEASLARGAHDGAGGEPGRTA